MIHYNRTQSQMTINLDGCGNVENEPLINVLLSEGVNVVEDRGGCAVGAVCHLDHMTETRGLFNGEHHLCRHNISLTHLKQKGTQLIYHDFLYIMINLQ